MTENTNLLNRIGRIFGIGRGNGNGGNGNGGDGPDHVVVETNPMLRYRGRNGPAIQKLHDGFESLTELMNSIRQNMDDQGRRQDQMLEHLSSLPRVLEMIPETTRVQGETLKAIHEQLLRQAEQQQILGEIFHKMSESGGDQKELLEGIRERVDMLNHQDKMMADSLSGVGIALESAGRNAVASAKVLENMRDHQVSRDTDLQQILQRQSSRYNFLLVIVLSITLAAVGAAAWLGYLMLHVAAR